MYHGARQSRRALRPDVNSFRKPWEQGGIVPVMIDAFRRYPIVGALAIVLIVNFTLLRVDPLQGTNPDTLPAAKTWVWWATQDFKKQEPPADIAILGCSIVMHSLWFAEAQHRNKDVELIVDHESKALSDRLAQLVPGLTAKAFNFGLPGAMLSDDCMIVRSMFNGKRTPKVVVLGVSPRDTYDNTFNTPAATKHYQYLARFTDPPTDNQDLLVPLVWERPKFWAQKAVYLKDKSKAIQNVASAKIREAGEPVLNRFGTSPLDKIPDDDRSLAMFKDELERGFWIAKPNSPYRYLESGWDAKRKIGKANPKMFNIQSQWLDYFMKECKQRNVAVVLVNTPNSTVARGVMGNDLYQRHLALLKEVSEKYNCKLVNADQPERYVPTDWTDWAHMTDKGGAKILDSVAKAIAEDSTLVAALKSTHSREIAGASPSPAGN
jgi:hypothetical protein